MSGGKFNYLQDEFLAISNSIHAAIDENKDNYSDRTINKFKNAVVAIQMAYVYAQRIDWLLSGDDSEESFHERMHEDMKKIRMDIINGVL